MTLSTMTITTNGNSDSDSFLMIPDENAVAGSCRNDHHEREDDRPSMVLSPSLKARRMSVADRAKWLLRESSKSNVMAHAHSNTNNNNIKYNRKDEKHNGSVNDENGGVVTTTTKKSRLSVGAGRNVTVDGGVGRCNDLGIVALTKTNKNTNHKSAVQLRREALEREQMERQRNADPRNFQTTTWAAKPNGAFGKYQKKLQDSRGLPPKRSLADLP